MPAPASISRATGLPKQLHFWLASSGGGDLAAVPQPRTSASGAANAETPSLNEMPALAGSVDTTPESWPDLSAADLLAQSAALGDRSLKDTAFDQPPWRRFARPFVAPEGRPLLGLLVTGLGTDRAVTAAAIAGLPAEVSLSFNPHRARPGRLDRRGPAPSAMRSWSTCRCNPKTSEISARLAC